MQKIVRVRSITREHQPAQRRLGPGQVEHTGKQRRVGQYVKEVLLNRHVNATPSASGNAAPNRVIGPRARPTASPHFADRYHKRRKEVECDLAFEQLKS